MTDTWRTRYAYTLIVEVDDPIEGHYLDTLQRFATWDEAVAYANNGVGDDLDVDLYTGCLDQPNPARLTATRHPDGHWQHHRPAPQEAT